MAMPDKIRIIGVERNKNGAFGNWTTRPFNGEVYIRKEALLKWAYKDLDPAAYLQLKNKLEEM